MKPFVGPPTEGEGCAYSAELDEPACGMPPGVHLLVRTPGWGLVALTSCGAHVGIALASGEWMRGHPYGIACRDGPCWDGPDRP